MKTLKIAAVGCAGVLLVLSAGRAAAPGYESAVNREGIWAYYRFGEKPGTKEAADASGKSHAASYVGDPKLGVEGMAGDSSDTAVQFNGSSQCLQAGDAWPGFGPALKNSSYEFVLKTDDTEHLGWLVGMYNGGDSTFARVGVNAAGGAYLEKRVSFNLRDKSGTSVEYIYHLPELFDGKYHHLVFTYDHAAAAKERVKAYIDGVAATLLNAGADDDVKDFSEFQFPPMIGAANARGTASDFFSGTIDEAAFFTKTLTADEVLAHCRALKGT
jgi:hypothetical protein